MMLHIPILRYGRPYRSLDTVIVPHHRTREPFVEISQANAGLIRRDLRDSAAAWDILQRFTVEELLAICARAADHFMNDALPLGDATQTPEDYLRQLSATTGMPRALGRRNMEKIRAMFTQMRDVLAGLTRNLDLRVLDAGGGASGQEFSFYPRGHSLGVVLPSNSPGVHALWIPAIPLKIPLVLKPGSAEPWTPWRIIQAFLRAGCPAGVFCYYPAGHEAGAEILRRTGRGMVFGDAGALRIWAGDPRIELHGPGYSKVLLGPDCAPRWRDYLEVMVDSIVANGGRSCVNASGIWTTAHGDEIAEALAERLARIVPLPAEDENAQLAPFTDPGAARRISAMIDAELEGTPARDLTAARRGPGAAERVVEFEGCTYLLPTIIRCGQDHPLAQREYLFPFAAVVQVKPEEIPAALGASLVVSAITEDRALIRRLMAAPISRLNLGPMSTLQIRWNQPHEGNLFDHLYARRALQTAAAGAR